MPHLYVLLDLNATFADSLDDAKRENVKDAIKDMITTIKRAQDADVFPPYLAQVRYSLNRRAVIVEGNFDAITKAEFVRRLATRLGFTQTQVNNNLTITVFGGGGATWEESRQATLSYLATNRAAWEADDVGAVKGGK